MAEPTSVTGKRVNVFITEQMHRDMKVIAARHGVTVNNEFLTAVRSHIDANKKVKR